jgi:hypothetical protein
MDILIWRVVPYKYQSDIEKNQLENNFFYPYFFSTNFMFTLIINKIKILKKLIEVIIYKFKLLLYQYEI